MKVADRISFSLLPKVGALYLIASAFHIPRRAVQLDQDLLIPLAISALLCTWAYFLFRGHWLARRIFSYALVLLAIVIPGGVINPLEASDILASGGTPPDLPELLAWIIPTEIVLLATAYMMDRKISHESA